MISCETLCACVSGSVPRPAASSVPGRATATADHPLHVQECCTTNVIALFPILADAVDVNRGDQLCETGSQSKASNVGTILLNSQLGMRRGALPEVA